MISFDSTHAGLAADFGVESYTARLQKAHDDLLHATGKGSDFVGWVHLPEAYDKAEYARIHAAAKTIRENYDALVVIGIGGSYLGSRAVLDLLGGDFPIYFAGNTLSTDAMVSLLNTLEGKDYAVNIISKSGTTTEPAVAFRIFKIRLEAKYGKAGAQSRIFATTDAQRGALKTLATVEGYESFVVPDNVGGRYSVLTAVGLLPLAAAGINIDALMAGAQEERLALHKGGSDNPAWQYAAARNALYHDGKKIEVLACYEPSFRFFAEWFKQLFGESEGKDGLGVFPASVEFTADLHSMGQYLQEGERILFETVVRFTQSLESLSVPADKGSTDGLDFLVGQSLDFVQAQAENGTRLAHVDGGVPNLSIAVPRRDAKSVGALIYFFEFACGLCCYLLGVNPFDQPGVEAYKKNMFALLGKPGYEDLAAELFKKL